MEAFDKLAYFLNGDNVEIDRHVLLLYNRSNLAKDFSVLPHEVDKLSIRDYWVEIAISDANKEKEQLKTNIEEAWNL